MDIHLMKCWSEKFDKIKQVQSEERNINLTRKSNSCDTDRGNKDLSYEFGISLKDLWKVPQIMSHGTPQYYGVLGCRNHTLLDSVW